MNQKLQAATIAFSIATLVVPQVYADDDAAGHFNNRNGIQRVLLITRWRSEGRYPGPAGIEFRGVKRPVLHSRADASWASTRFFDAV